MQRGLEVPGRPMLRHEITPCNRSGIRGFIWKEGRVVRTGRQVDMKMSRQIGAEPDRPYPVYSSTRWQYSQLVVLKAATPEALPGALFSACSPVSSSLLNSISGGPALCALTSPLRANDLGNQRSWEQLSASAAVWEELFLSLSWL